MHAVTATGAATVDSSIVASCDEPGGSVVAPTGMPATAA
jgi:hypothetical protein